jgi:hypothetical protein
MKAVQIGILAALLLCAGLLFKLYRGQPAAPSQPAVQPAAVTAPVPTAPVEQPAVAPAPEASAPPAPEPKKPSPSRTARPRHEVAANSRPAQPQPAPPPQAAVAPAPSPAPVNNAPVQPAPAPERAASIPPAGADPLPPPPPRVPHSVTIPAGTLLSVRLGETLSSDRNHPGDSFTATLDQPLVIDGFVIAERGARVQGKVSDAQEAGRVKGVSSLALSLTRLHTSDGQDVTLQTASFQKEGPQSRGEDAKKIGAGAAIGAVIGAIAGGGRGAAIGAGVGGAAGTGTVMATRGKAAELPVETRLSFRIEQPLTITERLK